MLAAVTTALNTVIEWVGLVVKALVGTGEGAGQLSALLPLFAIGIAVSALMLGIKAIKGFVWGS